MSACLAFATNLWLPIEPNAGDLSTFIMWVPAVLGVLLVLCLLLMRVWRAKRQSLSAKAKLSDRASSEERYRAFIQHSTEAIWRYELEKPVPVALPENEQIDMFYRYGYLAECNPAMARMYGFASPEEMTGMRVNIFLPRDNPRNIDFLRRFIRSGYQLVDAESFDVDRDGNAIHALNNMTGVIENGCGVRVWGTNRDITEHVRRELEAQTRERQQRALAELCQLAVATTDVESVFQRAAALVQQTLDVGGAAVVEYGADGSRWRVKAACGLPCEPFMSLRLSDPKWLSLGALDFDSQGRRPIIVGDGRSASPIPNDELLRRGIVSAMVAIICGPHETFGVLGAYHTKHREFTSDEIRFVQTLADTIGAVILRRTADEALRRSEAQHRTIVAQVKDYAIFMIDANGRASSWNEGVKRVLGYDEAEFVGGGLERLYTPEALARGVPQQELDAASRNGSSSNDRWMMRKDGSRFWASGITTCNRDVYGRLLGYTKVMRDLTEPRRVVQRLRKSRWSLSGAQRIAHIGNWELELRNLADVNANRLRWSNEVFRIFGLQPGEVEPSNELFFSLVPPEEHDRVMSAVQSALHGAGRYSIDHRIVLRDGTQKVVHEQAEVIHDRQGKPRRMIGTVQDITEQKRAEAELDQHRNHLEQLVTQRSSELEESNRKLRLNERMIALGTLSTGLGHDMGNLLLPIRARLDAMEHRLNGQVSDDVQAIRTATDYLQRLSNGLRLLAADTDQPMEAAGTTDLSSWWHDAEPILKNTLPGGISLTSEFPSNLPLVRVPRHHLTQAVFNLVQNAGDAIRASSRTHGGKVRVWAALRSAGSGTSRVVIGVTDNGMGMSAEVKRRCLEPFFTTKTRGISTGLGLALVHGIVRKAGGEMAVDSKPGRGATFIMKLPAAARAPLQSDKPAHRPRAVISLRDKRLRSYLRSLLEAWQYEVIESERAEASHAELWVTDASGDRAEIARRFVAEDGERRVIFIGNAPEGITDRHILQLDSEANPAMIRRALREIATTQTSME